jgi:DNA adenine methylase
MGRSKYTGRFFSPLRYPGGKSSIFPFVADLLRRNDLVGTSYAEPYAGGAGLALKLLFNEYVERVYINDLDPAIFAFWDAITDHGDEFCSWVSDVEITLDNWYAFKAIHRDPTSDPFELAKATFFLNRTNVSGVIKGGMIGGVTQAGKYKLDARFKKDELIQRIERVYEFRDRIHVSNQDGIKFLSRLNRVKRRIFVYLDPPYLQKADDLYMNWYQRRDHARLARFVRRLKKEWMVSYDNHEFILDLYKGSTSTLHRLCQATSNRSGEEALFFSSLLEIDSSLSKLNCARRADAS